MKIKKLPSGNYQTLLYSHKEDGKRKYKSITASTKTEVRRQASEFLIMRDELKERRITNVPISEACEQYIASKINVLSPSTVGRYRDIIKNGLQEVMQTKIFDLTQEDVQSAINEDATRYSARSVQNEHGFLSAVLQMYRPDMRLNTTLPKIQKKKVVIPSEEDVRKLMEVSAGTDMELPILLAAICGMRIGEICGLRWENVDIENHRLTINESKVLNEDRKWVSKTPKTVAGTRTIRIFEPVLGALERGKKEAQGEYVTQYTSRSIYKRYKTMMEKISPDNSYTFHQLRHYAVSVMLALNIPKKYIAEYIGHETESLINNVYGHAMAERRLQMETDLEKFYKNNQMQNVMQNEKKETQ